MGDVVDQAIATAANAEPAPLKMVQLNAKIASTGRPASILIPADATEGEIAELAGWMLTFVLKAARNSAAQRAAGRLAVVRSALPKSLRR